MHAIRLTNASRWLLLFAMALTVSSQPVLPEWSRDAIWYQIFPERFRNGDPANDPTAEAVEAPAASGWHVTPWTSDWYVLQPHERSEHDFWWSIAQRRYGGDLQGVLDKLGYLQELGVTAIYFNPVFEAFSSHKYDWSCLHHIDPHFGPDPEGDRRLAQNETEQPSTWHWTAADLLFRRLLQEAHQRGIHVVIDGVFNHSGTRCWAFQDVLKNQQRSRYAKWYDVTRWRRPGSTDEFAYKGWWNINDLPEFREDKHGPVAGPRDYFFEITRRWMDPDGDGDPSDGVDGWRMDVANEVSAEFWKEWRLLVKKLNPQTLIIGEFWENAAAALQGDQFDSVMNYRFARTATRFFIDNDTNRLSPTGFDAELERLRADYPAPVNYSLMNLFDSHDTARLATIIVNPNRKYNERCSPRQDPTYEVRKPNAAQRRIQRLMLLFQFAYLGAPVIYYGDEAGMWGANDPDDRKPMLWEDMKFAPERTHPLPGKTRPRDRVTFDRDLFSYYQRLIQIRKEQEPLRRGDFNRLLCDDNRQVYAFTRATAAREVIIVLNNSTQTQRAELPRPGRFQDALSNKRFQSREGILRLNLPPQGGLMLIRVAKK